MGKRNRQRGQELQRQIVRMAKENGLTKSFNRDRGGAQHEQGDVEIHGIYFGCKRRSSMAKWIKPEKQEIGVFIREDFGEPLAVVPAEWFLELLNIDQLHAKKNGRIESVATKTELRAIISNRGEFGSSDS